MLVSKKKWIDATAALKGILAMLLGSLVLSSCGGQAESTDPEPSTTQAISASWSSHDFDDVVAYCDELYGEPSSLDPAGVEMGPLDVDCLVVVRQNVEELGCPVDGAREVLEETRRLIELDIQFDQEEHPDEEVADWPLEMQSQLEDVYERAGCRESLILGW